MMRHTHTKGKRMAWSTTKDRPIKKQVTEGLFKHIKEMHPNYVFKCFFCLPSTKATDVEEALKQGVIDENTKIIAIEKKHKYLRELHGTLDRLGFDSESRVVICKDLCDLSTYELATACKELGVEGVDLFYIDTCNCLVDCVQYWIQNVACNEMVALKNSVIAINVIGARATWDLYKYPNTECPTTDTFGSNANRNPWANKIAQCLKQRTNRDVSLTAGYKEYDGSPMVLCVLVPSKVRATMRATASMLIAANLLKNLGYKGYSPKYDPDSYVVDEWKRYLTITIKEFLEDEINTLENATIEQISEARDKAMAKCIACSLMRDSLQSIMD